MTPEQQPATKQDLAALEARIIAAITRTADALPAKQDRAVESIGGEFSELRAEMARRFEEVDHRFEGLDRRMERINEGMRAVEIRMAALSRWADNLDRDNTAMNSSQAAQQRAIDQLNARVARIERQLHPEEQQ